jgi:hypothetical protein
MLSIELNQRARVFNLLLELIGRNVVYVRGSLVHMTNVLLKTSSAP